MAIALSYDPVLSRVRVAVSSPPAGAVSVTVERSTDQIRWTVVRGGLNAPLVSGTATVDDYEFVPDVANFYRSSVVVRVAEGFEDATLDITITNGGAAAWARNNTQAHTGTWSLKSGSIGNSQNSDAIVTIPSGAAVMSFWYKVSSEVGFDFFQAWLDSEPDDLAAASGEVGWIQVTASVDGFSTVTFRYVKDTSTAGGSDAAWVDDIAFDVPGVADDSDSITPTITDVWLKSVQRPFLNQSVNVSTVGDISRAARAGVFPVVGRTYPIAVSDIRTARQWDLGLWTDDAADGQKLELLLASGDTLLIQAPAAANLPTGYVSVGDVSERRISGLNPVRVWSLPCREVAVPGPDVVGSTSTYQTVINAYATYADLLADQPTYADLLELIGDPEDVIVP